jgi:Na+-transporting methylmalonyl-CoA/oxaloacetate decarboxylase gamma subunit
LEPVLPISSRPFQQLGNAFYFLILLILVALLISQSAPSARPEKKAKNSTTAQAAATRKMSAKNDSTLPIRLIIATGLSLFYWQNRLALDAKLRSLHPHQHAAF